MPRFIARPVVVEAHQYDGHVHLWPDAFRAAVMRYVPGGTIEVRTDDGARPCKHGDWVARGPDGFAVLKAATFETMFEAHVPPEGQKRSTKKELVNG